MRSPRLDLWLLQTGAFPSRARAQAAVRAGLVTVDGAVANKASALVPPGATVSVAGDVHDYVSRGALKLEAALWAFNIDPGGKTCLDLGASTGGFTEVLLRGGAAKVFAVDVGRGQLHASLLEHPRVISLEQTHARELTRALVPDPIGLLVCDVSFIGVTKALPRAMALCATPALLVTLVKPQFEVGPEKIGKGGLVSASPGELADMLDGVRAFIESAGWRVLGVIESPILGGDGNREFLLGAART